jgi:hypothetical protein
MYLLWLDDELERRFLLWDVALLLFSWSFFFALSSFFKLVDFAGCCSKGFSCLVSTFCFFLIFGWKS